MMTHVSGEFYIDSEHMGPLVEWGQRFLYPRNQRYLLNQFQVFQIEKLPTRKSYDDFLSRNST